MASKQERRERERRRRRAEQREADAHLSARLADLHREDATGAAAPPSSGPQE